MVHPGLICMNRALVVRSWRAMIPCIEMMVFDFKISAPRCRFVGLAMPEKSGQQLTGPMPQSSASAEGSDHLIRLFHSSYQKMVELRAMP